MNSKHTRSNASLVFPLIQKELEKEHIKTSLNGLFVVHVLLRNGQEDWFLLFKDGKSVISKQRPQTALEPTEIFISDRHLLNFVSGGLSGIKGIASGQIKVQGDLELASELEQLFVKAGGVEKTMNYISELKNKL